ncbi:MAG: TusE/DsrC/DsvC family sulfur relay protein [Arenicellales bacterium]
MHTNVKAADTLPPVDNEGYLLDPSDWTVEIALALAETVNIDMTPQHWAVVYFVIDYYETNQQVPETRRALKWMKTAPEFGEELATRKGLYKMFPYGFGQQACKIAGMRKPLKLILDL